MSEPLRYFVEIEAEKVTSRLVVVIALLEELKRMNPREYPIAVKAIQDLEKESV